MKRALNIAKWTITISIALTIGMMVVFGLLEWSIEIIGAYVRYVNRFFGTRMYESFIRDATIVMIPLSMVVGAIVSYSLVPAPAKPKRKKRK